MAWTFKNYNAFLREAKHEFGITHAEAQALYREGRDYLERPLVGVDVDRHPRILKRLVDEIREEREIDTLEEWEEEYAEAEDYEEPDDWEGAFDTGGKRKK